MLRDVMAKSQESDHQIMWTKIISLYYTVTELRLWFVLH